MSPLVLIAATILVRLAVIGHPFTANNESTACAPLLSVARNYVRYLNSGNIRSAERWPSHINTI